MDAERRGHQVTFEDCWAYLEEIESATGARLDIKIAQPRRLKGGALYRARVAVTATRLEGKQEKARTSHCEIGGARGARTVPAALVRAATELAARLAEATEDAEQLAAF